MRINIILTWMIIILSVGSGSAQTYELSDFVEIIPPKYGSNQWHGLNQSDYEFEVKIVNGRLNIFDHLHKTECELKMNNGNLIGINHGEWGGKLSFLSSDTAKKELVIKDGNVMSVFKFKGNIYFIEGLAHMTSSSGALYQFDTTDNKFTWHKIIDFNDAPEAVAVYQDKILIASHENFYVVKNFKKNVIFRNTFWSSLYPNSIGVIDEKNVYMGIRSGIVKIDLTVKSMKFLKYRKVKQ